MDLNEISHKLAETIYDDLDDFATDFNFESYGLPSIASSPKGFNRLHLFIKNILLFNEWLPVSDTSLLEDGKIFCAVHERNGQRTSSPAQYKDGKWLVHFNRSVIDVTEYITMYKQLPPAPGNYSYYEQLLKDE